MGNTKNGQAIDLLERIAEMIDGEDASYLQEVESLLKAHMGIKAGVIDGDKETINSIIRGS